MERGTLSRAPVRRRGPKTLAWVEALCTGTGDRGFGPEAGHPGPKREGEELGAVMHEPREV